MTPLTKRGKWLLSTFTARRVVLPKFAGKAGAPPGELREAGHKTSTADEGDPRLLALLDRVPDALQDVSAVRIHDDEQAVTYEVTVVQRGGSAILTSLTVLPDSDQPVTRDLLRRIPVQAIADAALNLQRGPGAPTRIGETRSRSTPTLDEVAAVYKDDTRPEHPRQRVLDTYGGRASAATLDRRIRQARDAGLIRSTTRGRPRKNTASTNTPTTDNATKRETPK